MDRPVSRYDFSGSSRAGSDLYSGTDLYSSESSGVSRSEFGNIFAWSGTWSAWVLVGVCTLTRLFILIFVKMSQIMRDIFVKSTESKKNRQMRLTKKTKKRILVVEFLVRFR